MPGPGDSQGYAGALAVAREAIANIECRNTGDKSEEEPCGDCLSYGPWAPSPNQTPDTAFDPNTGRYELTFYAEDCGFGEYDHYFTLTLEPCTIEED